MRWVEIRMDSDTWVEFHSKARERGYPHTRAQKVQTEELFPEYIFTSGAPLDVALAIQAEIKEGRMAKITREKFAITAEANKLCRYCHREHKPDSCHALKRDIRIAELHGRPKKVF